METLIKKSLQELIKLESISNSKGVNYGKLVFPIKSDGAERISEQEARLLLIKKLEEQVKYQYSVEAPTVKKYSFTGENKRSGNIDLCIYENGERKHLIEFKSHNPVQSAFTKDFKKLLYDVGGLDNYFIHILNDKNKRTIPSVEGKYREAINSFRGEKIKSSLKIFVCVLKKEEVFYYEVDKNGNLSERKPVNF